ncbi:hypothetical protein SARC_01272, partial [Sphaeroforma arctica JP610]
GDSSTRLAEWTYDINHTLTFDGREVKLSVPTSEIYVDRAVCRMLSTVTLFVICTLYNLFECKNSALGFWTVNQLMPAPLKTKIPPCSDEHMGLYCSTPGIQVE